MANHTLSIIKNKNFLEIINELQILSKFKIKFYDNLKLCLDEIGNNNNIMVIFKDLLSQEEYEKIIKKEIPIMFILNPNKKENIMSRKFFEKLNTPFRILEFEKKITFLAAKYEFNKSSLIDLNGYKINKNERKIKKNNLELELTEKEVNFLILFSQNNKPLSKNFVLEKVWNYSPESDTHTVETHIHRLRKKILDKFNDDNFIKNNEKGYYI